MLAKSPLSSLRMTRLTSNSSSNKQFVAKLNPLNVPNWWGCHRNPGFWLMNRSIPHQLLRPASPCFNWAIGSWKEASGTVSCGGLSHALTCVAWLRTNTNVVMDRLFRCSWTGIDKMMLFHPCLCLSSDWFWKGRTLLNVLHDSLNQRSWLTPANTRPVPSREWRLLVLNGLWTFY